MIDDFKRPPQRPAARIDNLRGTPPLPPPVNYGRPYPQYNNSPAAPAPSHRQPAHSRETGSYGRLSTDIPGPTNFQPPSAPAKKSRNPFRKLRNLSRKQAIALSVVLLLLLGGGGAGAFAFLSPDPEPIASKPKQAKPAPKPAPKPILSPLTGIPVTAEQQARPVIGVMIENSGNARPQSGLKDAGVVYEAIAEYGVTRFMAVYQETNPANIGPIRSVRPYYLDWIMPYDAAIAHVGGSPEALQRIKDIGTKDLDQFFNAGAYHRINTRYAPHNMYSSMDALMAANKARGFEKSTFEGFPRKAKEEPSKAPTAKGIDLAISGAFFNVRYDYEPSSNSYNRAMAGTPHMDADSNTQLKPKVVIALSMAYSLMPNGLHSQYQTTGTGPLHVFQDGLVKTGSWHKADVKEQFVFKDDGGNPIKLNPGQTWITVVGDPAKVTYTP